MTKRDFELVARVLASEYVFGEGESEARHQTVIDIATTFAAVFEDENPRFDRSKFMQAVVGNKG